MTNQPTREALARAMFEANGGKSESRSLNADQNAWTDDQNMKVYRKLADAALSILSTALAERDERIAELEEQNNRLLIDVLFVGGTIKANLDWVCEVANMGIDDEGDRAMITEADKRLKHWQDYQSAAYEAHQAKLKESERG